MGISTSDGWRGVIGKEFNMKKIYQIMSNIINCYGIPFLKNGVCIGFDNRKGGEEISHNIAGYLSSLGINVYIGYEPAITSAVTIYAIKNSLAMSIIITASHYPMEYNGLKIRINKGVPLTKDEMLHYVKGHKDTLYKKKGIIKKVNFKKGYVEFLIEKHSRLLDLLKCNLEDDKIVVESFGGCAGGYIKEILSNYGWKIYEQNNLKDCINCRPDPIEENCEPLKIRVAKESAILGFAFDGDGDRIGVVNSKLEYYDSTMISSMILKLWIYRKWLNEGDTIVKTHPVSGVLNLISKNKLKIIETEVGYYNLYRTFAEKSAKIGFGDDSSFICENHYTKDAILSALNILAIINNYSKKFYSDIINLRPLYYRLNIVFENDNININDIFRFLKEKLILWANREFNNQISGIIQEENSVKIILYNYNWILLRNSGTENVLRAYIETKEIKEYISFKRYISEILTDNKFSFKITKYTKLN